MQIQLLFNLKNFLTDLGEKINDFLSKYTGNASFWVITAVIILIICYWAIRYFGKE